MARFEETDLALWWVVQQMSLIVVFEITKLLNGCMKMCAF